MPPTQDFPPLLPDGLHPRTLDEVQALCVNAFPLSQSRPRLLTGLRALVQALSEDGFRADLWVDGSFVTGKLNPADIDVVLHISPADDLTEAQWARIASFISVNFRARVKDEYGCDFYFILEPISKSFEQYQQ